MLFAFMISFSDTLLHISYLFSRFAFVLSKSCACIIGHYYKSSGHKMTHKRKDSKQSVKIMLMMVLDTEISWSLNFCIAIPGKPGF